MTQVDKDFKENLSWEEKAKKNPLFAVMSSEEFSNIGPDEWTKEDLQTFFLKGQAIFDTFLSPVITRANIDRENAFIVEYGSGMGRILKAVYAAGFKCGGIDISPTMLEYSRKLVSGISCLSCIDAEGNCQVPSNSADFVYSYAVIPHINRLSYVRKAISEICRILKPGCLTKFQYMSLPNELPFKKLKSVSEEHLYNFEDNSLLVRKSGFKLYEHNNWAGVRLSFANLERFLNECGVALVGIEQDIGKIKGNMFWALGKKAS